MKKLLTLVSVLALSTFCYSQDSSSEKVSTKKQIDIIAENEVDTQVKIDATNIPGSSNLSENEYTNNPESTGSVKKVINGKEVYVKETEVNGIKSSVIYEPK